MNRITHRDVIKACTRHNVALQLTRDDTGYLQWADIRGDGKYRPNLYATSGRGVTQSHLRGRTMRETIANIDHAIKLNGLADYAIIIRCIHDQQTAQVSALSELNRRGLWLSPEQRKQAGLLP